MPDLDAIADEAFAVLDTGRQVTPFSDRHPRFAMADAYRVTDLVRQKREDAGARRVGRKIGFTNRTIWPQYGVYAPMWGFVYDTTVRHLADLGAGFPLAGLAEPRIEPEVIFSFETAPSADMDERALLDCIEWVSHGFEIVQSIFPDWKFTGPDTVAGYGLHGALFIGPTHPVAGRQAYWLDTLASFEIDLFCNGAHIDRGKAANVMDGPLTAIRHLLALLAEDPINPPLAAGEIVTTGTLTKAMPVKPGEAWSTRPHDIELEPAAISFA
jgi:2-oxo-3-hexenedioate decarboxylase